MSVYGYDPARVEILHRRTREALVALDAIRSEDPAAADAMRAIALARDTLERGWLPFIGAIRTSTAMTAWRTALGADASRGLVSNRVIANIPSRGSPATSWIVTNGLDDLTDTEVVDRLDDSIERFRAAVAGGDDLDHAERRLAVFADEAVRRARHDRGQFASLMQQHLGDRGAIAILGAIDALDASSRRDPRRHGIPPAALDLAELLAPLGAVASVVELIGAHLRSSTSLAPLITATSQAWDPTVLVGLTTGLIRAIDERHYLMTMVTPIELAGNVDALSRALAHDPAASLAVLGDDVALDYIATNIYLAAPSVEAVITAGLLNAPRAGGAAMRDGLDALSRLVVISDDDLLNDGTKRGLAAAMLTFFPVLAPQLDVRIPVVVPYGTDSDHTVEIGDYCDLQRLFGQLLADDAAQLVLGAMTERYRVAETAGLATTIAAHLGDEAGEQRARIAAALADVSAIGALVLRSRAARTSLAAYEHGLVVGRAKSVISWAAAIGSAVVPSARAAIPIASEVVTTALDLTRPAQVRNLGADAASAIGFTVTVVGLPTSTPRIRGALGLGSVPAATWQRLDDLLEELADTDDHERRLAIHSTIVAIAAADPDLDLFVTQLETLGGDAANAGPQPPASCS
ncbi:MAG TPA: hypothetical protein VNO51_12355 [Ilumatobacteraceae bacterium]|nr:hypothetical protein [Ilumatobacteraceae bacterium]